MDEIMIKIIELIVIILAALIGRYAIPYIKTKVDMNKLALISEWALKFVKTAENVIVGSGMGEEKRNQVVTWIKEKSNEVGIKLTEDQIRTILEDAYTTMIQESNEFKETVDNK